MIARYVLVSTRVRGVRRLASVEQFHGGALHILLVPTRLRGVARAFLLTDMEKISGSKVLTEKISGSRALPMIDDMCV